MSSNESTRDDLIARIQKLLALSERNANEHESQAAAAKAQALLTEFNLTLDDVGTPAESKQQPVVLRTVDYPNGDEPWERDLHSFIAAAFYCRAVRDSYGARAHFIGRTTNADVAMYVFEQLGTRLPELANMAFKAFTQDWKKQHGKSFWTSNKNIPAIKGNYVRNWLKGTAVGIYEQLMAQQEAQTGLVVSTQAENAAAVQQFFRGSLRAAAKHAEARYNESAYNGGVQAGRSLDIRSGIGGSEPRKQLG